MDRKPRILGYYNYTVILTYVGLLSGFAGIILAFENKRFYAVLCLMAAGFCDMFDGAAAATKERISIKKKAKTLLNLFIKTPIHKNSERVL